jgi:hypothetical protein
MSNRTKQFITVMSAIILLASISGCSIFISTPRTAKIHIQGLDNQHYDYTIALDEPSAEANLDIRISKRYAVQLDFDWLWDSAGDSRTSLYNSVDEDMIPLLVPWMMCKYRF